MRKIMLFCVVSFVMYLVGCTTSPNNDSTIKSETPDLNIESSECDLNIESSECDLNIESSECDLNIESGVSDYRFTSLHVDYPLYKNAEDIVNASANIYTGTVKSISFEIIDMETGKVDDSSESQSTSRVLYTVYTVSLINSIKGDNPSEIKICKIGGMVGYKEAEQYSKMESSGLLNSYDGIPEVDESTALNIGSKYLFCTHRVEGHDFVINLTQFAHPIDSDNANLIFKASKY